MVKVTFEIGKFLGTVWTGGDILLTEPDSVPYLRKIGGEYGTMTSGEMTLKTEGGIKGVYEVYRDGAMVGALIALDYRCLTVEEAEKIEEQNP